MRTNPNYILRAFTFAIAALIIALIVEQVVIGNVEGEVATKQETLAQVQTQVSDAQSQNATLSSQQADKLVEYRNAQGRMSFLGDGSGKVAYLTFDDGPSKALTKKNLKILKQKNAVATWFCLGNEKDYEYLDLSLCKNIEAQGSAVGIHDWDQNDSYSYYKGTVANYMKSDFNKAKKAVENAVGHEVKIMRFAGGSPTIGYYNSKIGTSLPRYMVEQGYQYFDWNALAYDSDPSYFENGSTPASTITSKILESARSLAKTNSPICVLMHDNPGKETTTKALPDIIDGLRELGYEFKTLDYDSPGFYQVKIKN